MCRFIKYSYFVFIHQKIGSLEVPVDYIVLVQIIHSLGNINCYFEQRWKLKYTPMFMQKVVYTPSRHEF